MKPIETTGINRAYIYFAMTSFIVCTLYAVFFVPVYSGDSTDYINIAKVFSGQKTNHTDYSLRSPLYPIFLSVIIRLFGEHSSLKHTVYAQYLMVFFSSLLVFVAFKRFISNTAVLFLIGVLYLINFSTITFGYLIISETLTLFLYVCQTFILMRYVENRKITTLLFSGLVTGLLILVRFNLILVPLNAIIIILITHFFLIKPRRLKQALLHSVTFSISVFFVVNIWCLVNLYTQGTYRLFPMSDITINRNAVLSTLNENNEVSEEYTFTLDIFLRAKKVVDTRNYPALKGSFLDLDANNYVHKLYSGYEIYIAALPELMERYGCSIENHEIVLSKKLSAFYKEIASQNKKELFEMRILSLLNGFRHSIASLPESLGDTNLNVLPDLIFKAYKVLFAAAMLLFVILTALYVLKLRKNNFLTHYPVIILLIQVIYFPIIDFLYITESNANRFKFPSEPLILGLTVFYLYYFIRKRKEKQTTNITQSSLFEKP